MPLDPLEGYTIAVTADRRWQEQADLLARRGARVVHAPTVRTDYITDEPGLRAATEAVITRPPDVLVATTGIGIRAWFEAAQTWDRTGALHDALAGAAVIARGPKSAAALQANDIATTVRVRTERMDEVLSTLMDMGPAGMVVAIQQYGAEDPCISAALVQAGASVIEVPVYRWRLPAEGARSRRMIESVCSGQIDAVTFTSAPAARNLVALAADIGREDALLSAFNTGDVVAACVGQVCAQGARDVGIETPVAPSVGRLGLLVRTVTEELEARRHCLALPGGTVTVQGRAIERNDQAIIASPREAVVATALADRGEAVVAKADLLRRLGRVGPAQDAHAVETVVARLRRRLVPLGLTVATVPKRGYRLMETQGRASSM